MGCMVQISNKPLVQMLRPWELQIPINYNCDRAVYIQIADAIITAVKNRKLIGNDTLPGSRQLAAQLKVNRNTVVQALDLLLAEGWIISQSRKATFVNPELPELKNTIHQTPDIPKSQGQITPYITFDDGIPDSRLSPMNELARAYRQLFSRKSRWQLMGYSQELGDPDFREAIRQMLNYKRDLKVTAEQLCITRGSQMAMYLTAHSLIEAGDYVLVEDPGYRPAWKALESAGAVLLPVSVDHEGMKTDDVITYLDKYKNIRAVYTTPHHQFPTTVMMSLQRRLELINLSNQYGFTIIEDDYDHEFHFEQRPMLPLSSYAHVHNFVYIGTLSKIVAPALRIGYLAGSREFIERVGSLRKIIDVQGDNIMEQAVLQLINEGEIRRHLKRTSALYKKKRDVFDRLLHKYLDGKATWHKPDGGLAFWLVPALTMDIEQLTAGLLAHGIRVQSPSQFSFDKLTHGFRLGYASLNEEQLEEGVRQIAALIKV
jgi:GntR family transcriptional regulator/MocR family aminotransferase